MVLAYLTWRQLTWTEDNSELGTSTRPINTIYYRTTTQLLLQLTQVP